MDPCVKLMSQGISLRWEIIGSSVSCQTFVTNKPPSDQPKKPGNAYTIFYKEQFPLIAKANPDLNSKSIARVAGLHWKGMPESNKKVYQEAFTERMVAYRAAMSSLTAEEIASMKEIKAKRDKKRSRLRKRKVLAEMNRPRKPPAAFFQFCMEDHPSFSAKFSKHSEKISALASHWRSMSAEEKMPYTKRYEKQLIVYLEEKAAWEERMMQTGYEHLCTGYKKPKKEVLKKKKKRVVKKAAKKNRKAKTAKKPASKAKKNSAVSSEE
ncbi:hypothetical protein CAPTEDRAFT_219366 [Capitella teleta]|uniref:HMG box domain-containing protein n=1 Tax=Capitella teleta TaxID=283909 RepID=R7TFL7_CAPTE|nr:hypothetical protein CAPTEDRAFT_219366 [Capitella teleta]|eukprot:ELT92544.1 hypothetical protein CAPTEDRAFT_219366 [Capitella teleta]